MTSFSVIRRKNPNSFGKLKNGKADPVWKHLFVENATLSEATPGVITVLSELGLDANTGKLNELGDYFRSVDHRITKSNFSYVVMKNDLFNAEKVEVWQKNQSVNDKFSAALRMVRLLKDWLNISLKQSWDKDLSGDRISSIRNFLDIWIAKMNLLYIAFFFA